LFPYFGNSKKSSIFSQNGGFLRPVEANMLSRDFTTNEPDKVVGVGYHQHRYGRDRLYLTVFIDVFFHMVVGWASSSWLSTHLSG